MDVIKAAGRLYFWKLIYIQSIQYILLLISVDCGVVDSHLLIVFLFVLKMIMSRLEFVYFFIHYGVLKDSSVL